MQLKLQHHVSSILIVTVWQENYEWCSLSEAEQERYLDRIRGYRAQVRALVLRLLASHPVHNPVAKSSLHWVLLMGMEHEKIHLETSAVIISQVPIQLIRRNHNFNYKPYYEAVVSEVACPGDAPSNTLVRVPGGTVRLGKEYHEQVYS